jgi:hypothetical protein
MAASNPMIAIGLLLVLFVVPVTIGVVLILASRRGRLNYPACGKCQYNLMGSVGKTDRCPECGSLFTQAGILPPDRTSRRGLLWTGVVLVSMPLTCLGFWGVLMAVANLRMQSQPAIVPFQPAGGANQPAAQQAAPIPPPPKSSSDGEPAPSELRDDPE